MKRWIFSVFMPLVLAIQSPALAQTESAVEAGGQGDTFPKTTAVDNEQGALVALPGTEQIQLQLVNCSGWLDCSLARWFLPDSAFLDRRQLQFDNPTSTAASVLNTAAIAQGATNNYPLTSEISIPKGSLSLAANQISGIPLNIQRSALPPDRYTGAVYMTLIPQQNRLVLPLNISVRSGPLMPLVFLLLGIILGQLFKYWQERGEPQTKAYQEVMRLESDIRAADLEDQAILLPMEKRAKKLVVREQLEKANSEFELIRNRLDVLIKLRTIEAVLKQPDQSLSQDEIKEALQQINLARQEIKLANDAKAQELLETVNNILVSISTRGFDTVNEELQAAARGAVNQLEKNRKIVSLSFPEIEPSQWERLQQYLINLFGFSEQVRAEANFWVVRPLLWLTLLIGLSAVGMVNLYVENGSTFGAKRFADYFGLILWGLSANVASSSLSSLPVLRGQTGASDRSEA
ncbi:hypothetical protein C7B80_16710 [Cyanosarcina cf. burmensis CCALA 770]|nr:hypothetical protein C7B80_16710 [Cyanosarcina cf. burmensis CCALA 770]